ncbi:MAG TPA: M50 family metallopeptidase [Solirubrobacterales bacterium]|nr:M50 family metallopeptidase [Solirubrobacterales bacterium]
MSWFLAFAGFAALIILHEFGHFLAAKATGMRVERFFLFFPPALAKFRRGETEYGIGAIPLGGFVKITGMNPEEELPPEVAPRAYYHQPVWKRIVTIAAGPAMNLLIAFLVLFLLAFGVSEPTENVGEIEGDSPASQQLRNGDLIVSVDGERGDQLDLARAVNRHKCAGGEEEDGCRAATPARVVIERDGQRKVLEITPEYDADLDRSRLGFSYATTPVNPSVPEAARISVDFMWQVTSATVSVIARLFDPEQREQISGVVGGYETTRQAIEFDARRALTLIGVISLSLAVINLFPFLPLDGGHIFWSLVEKVRGRPVPFSVMERAGVIGFVLVLILFLVGLSNDIDRLSGEGFDVR